jgi:hypothetical protein
MVCSDIWAIHPRKCNHGKKEVSLVARAMMKSLLEGTGTFAKCIAVMIAELAVTGGLGSSCD